MTIEFLVLFFLCGIVGAFLGAAITRFLIWLIDDEAGVLTVMVIILIIIFYVVIKANLTL